MLLAFAKLSFKVTFVNNFPEQAVIQREQEEREYFERMTRGDGGAPAQCPGPAPRGVSIVNEIFSTYFTLQFIA